MAKYISFVFHHRSNQVEAKQIIKVETNDDINEDSVTEEENMSE